MRKAEKKYSRGNAIDFTLLDLRSLHDVTCAVLFGHRLTDSAVSDGHAEKGRAKPGHSDKVPCHVKHTRRGKTLSKQNLSRPSTYKKEREEDVNRLF